YSGTRPLRDHVAVAWLVRREIADHVQALCRGAEIGVGKLTPVRDREVGTRYLDCDDAHMRIACRDFRSGEIAGCNIVVIPKTEVDRMAAREQLPYLWREDAEVCARVCRGFRTGVRGQYV